MAGKPGKASCDAHAAICQAEYERTGQGEPMAYDRGAPVSAAFHRERAARATRRRAPGTRSTRGRP